MIPPSDSHLITMSWFIYYRYDSSMDLLVFQSELFLFIDSICSGAHTAKEDQRPQRRCMRVRAG
jgi:hypothetical protein